MIDYKYLELYILLVKLRFHKAVEAGVFGSREWYKIIEDHGWGK
jgi:hypothetical protein